jgi:hypothetical protein
VEARQLNGYDTHNPGQAVIIHEVLPGRENPAHVIDIDNNGNTGDAGAMWVPGETYLAPSLGIVVSVISATESGYMVRISNHFISMEQVDITGASRYIVKACVPATVSPWMHHTLTCLGGHRLTA